jgi:DNA-binding transcriptional ArsR family regulator
MSCFTQDPTTAAEAAEILKALGHPIRLGVVALLVREGPMNVSTLAERLDAKQPIISQQLRILRMRGLVEAIRENGHATYRFAEPHLVQLVNCMESCCVGRRGACCQSPVDSSSRSSPARPVLSPSAA